MRRGRGWDDVRGPSELPDTVGGRRRDREGQLKNGHPKGPSSPSSSRRRD